MADGDVVDGWEIAGPLVWLGLVLLSGVTFLLAIVTWSIVWMAVSYASYIGQDLVWAHWVEDIVIEEEDEDG